MENLEAFVFFSWILIITERGGIIDWNLEAPCLIKIIYWRKKIFKKCQSESRTSKIPLHSFLSTASSFSWFDNQLSAGKKCQSESRTLAPRQFIFILFYLLQVASVDLTIYLWSLFPISSSQLEKNVKVNLGP